ncbi:MAG TPA: hypothetical protein VFS21_25185 [Roseiflexaceae bacterium]|nr:hypothetical protein [Roseiflexaceae bacterium]
MEQRKADLLVYIPLAIATATYAAILDRLEAKIKPDGTWVEVVIGTTMCLVAADIRAHLGPDRRDEVIRAVHLAFQVGGAPVIIWQVARAIARWRRTRRILGQHYHRD